MDLKTFTDNFHLLADTPNGIPKLREMILQLAVMGKLVPQDPNDEPASVLLEKITKEKERLIAEGKTKKTKPLPLIDPEEIPYELPTGWEWVRMQNISIKVHYGYTASADAGRNDVKFLRITDIQNDRVAWANVPGCEIRKELVSEYALSGGDILVARTGGTIGKSYLVTHLEAPTVFASYLIRIIPAKHVNARYLKLFLSSKLYWDQLYQMSMGTGQPNVNGTSLKSLNVPLAPLGEQKRIVERANELLALCDRLEEQKKNSDSLGAELMSATVRRLSI